ncbi:hypothetical protein FRB99_001055 [Tulasnella sp. 403]|nr:hypothetical protein FRB99_001055 [Tulasnella sp. 403]
MPKKGVRAASEVASPSYHTLLRKRANESPPSAFKPNDSNEDQDPQPEMRQVSGLTPSVGGAPYQPASPRPLPLTPYAGTMTSLPSIARPLGQMNPILTLRPYLTAGQPSTTRSPFDDPRASSSSVNSGGSGQADAAELAQVASALTQVNDTDTAPAGEGSAASSRILTDTHDDEPRGVAPPAYDETWAIIPEDDQPNDKTVQAPTRTTTAPLPQASRASPNQEHGENMVVGPPSPPDLPEFPPEEEYSAYPEGGFYLVQMSTSSQPPRPPRQTPPGGAEPSSNGFNLVPTPASSFVPTPPIMGYLVPSPESEDDEMGEWPGVPGEGGRELEVPPREPIDATDPSPTMPGHYVDSAGREGNRQGSNRPSFNRPSPSDSSYRSVTSNMGTGGLRSTLNSVYKSITACPETVLARRPTFPERSLSGPVTSRSPAPSGRSDRPLSQYALPASATAGMLEPVVSSVKRRGSDDDIRGASGSSPRARIGYLEEHRVPLPDSDDEDPNAPRRKGPRVVKFYNAGSPYYEFTNFAPYEVKYQGKPYPTSEHLFQAMKFLEHRPLLAEHIRLGGRAPRFAFQEARRFSPEVRKDWQQRNIEFMDVVLELKFKQHKDLKKMLLSTKDAILIEARLFHKI